MGWLEDNAEKAAKAKEEAEELLKEGDYQTLMRRFRSYDDSVGFGAEAAAYEAVIEKSRKRR